MADQEPQDFEFDISDLDLDEYDSPKPVSGGGSVAGQPVGDESAAGDSWAIEDLDVANGPSGDESESSEVLEESPPSIADDDSETPPRKPLKKGNWAPFSNTVDDLLDTVEALETDGQLVDEAEFQSVVRNIEKEKSEKASAAAQSRVRRPTPTPTHEVPKPQQASADPEVSPENLPSEGRDISQKEMVSELEESVDTFNSLIDDIVDTPDSVVVENEELEGKLSPRASEASISSEDTVEGKTPEMGQDVGGVDASFEPSEEVEFVEEREELPDEDVELKSDFAKEAVRSSRGVEEPDDEIVDDSEEEASSEEEESPVEPESSVDEESSDSDVAAPLEDPEAEAMPSLDEVLDEGLEDDAAVSLESEEDETEDPPVDEAAEIAEEDLPEEAADSSDASEEAVEEDGGDLLFDDSEEEASSEEEESPVEPEPSVDEESSDSDVAAPLDDAEVEAMPSFAEVLNEGLEDDAAVSLESEEDEIEDSPAEEAAEIAEEDLPEEASSEEEESPVEPESSVDEESSDSDVAAPLEDPEAEAMPSLDEVLDEGLEDEASVSLESEEDETEDLPVEEAAEIAEEDLPEEAADSSDASEEAVEGDGGDLLFDDSEEEESPVEPEPSVDEESSDSDVAAPLDDAEVEAMPSLAEVLNEGLEDDAAVSLESEEEEEADSSEAPVEGDGGDLFFDDSEEDESDVDGELESGDEDADETVLPSLNDVLKTVADAESGPEESTAKEAADEDESEDSEDDRLLHAASILNDGELPDGVDSITSDGEKESSQHDDDDDVVALPSPSELINVAASDPEGLAEAEGENSGDDAETNTNGDEAEPDDSETPEAEGETPQDEEGTEPAESEVEGGNDPFASDSLDGFNVDLDAAEAEDDPMMSDDGEDSFAADEKAAAIASEEKEGEESSNKEQAKEAEEPEAAAPVAKKSKVKMLLGSLPIAAAIALCGLGWIAMTFKQEIVEHAIGYDQDGSMLVKGVKLIANEALKGHAEGDLYDMRWLDSEVKQVADNEIRINMVLEAVLKQNLYVSVSPRRATDRLSFSESEFREIELFAREGAPEVMDRYPVIPWENLYKLSSTKGKSVKMRVGYKLLREGPESEWALASVKVRGLEGDLVWPEGSPVAAFGQRGYDVSGLEFKEAVNSYNERALDFIDFGREYIESERGRSLQKERRQAALRKAISSGLVKGTFFKGVVIDGKEADEAANVVLVITESLEGGTVFKGVIKLEGESGVAKHFVGALQFEEHKDRTTSYLRLTTVSFEGAAPNSSRIAFFDSQTSTRMKLHMDGPSLEGDNAEVSLRLTRNM